MRSTELIIREQMALALLTTLGIGGPARYYLRAATPETVARGVAWARERNLPLLVLGRGSNLLVADEGFPGLVLHMAVHGFSAVSDGGMVAITAGAGERWDRLVTHAVARGWAGVECLAGIPGLVGATPVQNVGAYGQEVHETIAGVEALDRLTGRIVTFDNAACAFGYRQSRFKSVDRDRYIILSVTYRLRPGGAPHVHYIELERQLAEERLPHPTLAQVRQAVLTIRRRKSMLLDPTDPNAHSAGSFFINPALTPEEFAVLEETVAPLLEAGRRLPHFPTPDGRWVKVPAAWLIEHAGFSRGYRLGPVGVSQKHTLSLVNYDQATAQDILTLARAIRTQVYERFGVFLLPEPTLVGVSMDDDV